MAHEIEGENVFTVGRRPWHGLGKVLENAPTIEEGIRCAGLDWNVRLDQLVTQTGATAPAYATVRERLIKVERELPSGAIEYDEQTQEDVLGVVGPSYRVLQNLDAFQWFDPFLQDGHATLESAGSLFDGRKIWVLAKLKSDNFSIVKGDEIEKFILLQNSHDGSTAVRLGLTPIRVVCNNTLNMAINNNSSHLVRVFHMGDVKDTIACVREAINLADLQFEATQELYKKLAKSPINETDLRKLVKHVFTNKIESPADYEQAQDDRKDGRIVDRVVELFETGRGNDMKGVKGTKWAAYNAIVEYVQYDRGEDDNARFNNLWFRRGNSNKGEKALSLLLKAA